MLFSLNPDYKPMRLYDGGGNLHVDWYFDFSLKNPQTGALERIRRTFGINRIKDAKQRYACANSLIKRVNKALADGRVDYSYFFPQEDPQPETAAIGSERVVLPAEHTPVLTIANEENLDKPLLQSMMDQALATRFKRMQRIRKGVRKKPINKRTADTYNLWLRRFVDYLEQKSLWKIGPADFSTALALGFQDYLIEDRELANKTINETVGFIRSLYKDVRITKGVVGDCWEHIQRLPVDPSTKYIPFTSEEKIAIAEKLKAENYWMYLAAQFVYTLFIRPQELCCIRRRDIDLVRSNNKISTLVIRYDNAKVKRTSHREIPDSLYNLLLQMGIDKMPPDQLVFEKICGNHPHPDLRRKKLTDIWNELIIRGLGIDNNFYALKHTGNIDYILNNPTYDILWLQQQNGHSSLDMTQKYIRDLPIQRLAKSNGVVTIFGSPAAA